jgi:UDP-glucuronate 4-epimerase
MRVLVTGYAGFIGFHICKKLIKEKHHIIGIDNFNKYYDPRLKKSRHSKLIKFYCETKKKEYKDITSYVEFLNNGNALVKEDIKDYKILKQLVENYKPDRVLHLAAQAGVRYSLEAPFVYSESNLTGFMNILEICRNYNLPLVYASSSSVYGEKKEEKFKETLNTDEPVSLYAATKKANEVMAYSYSKLYDIPMTGLRFFTVYGPYGRPDMAIFKFTEKILKGETIDVYNSGNMFRDFTYIDDIVEGTYSALKKVKNHKIYNLGFGNTRKLIDFVKIIESNCGKKAKINFLPVQGGDVLKTSADISKAKKDLNFNPKTPLEEGVKNFVDWYKEYYFL